MRDFDDQRKAGVKVPVFDVDRFSDLEISREAWTLNERPDSQTETQKT